MKMLFAFMFGVFLAGITSVASTKDNRCFEMRTYHAAEGKIEDLHNRFRKHTNKLFEKHGIAMVGYWVPLDKEGKKDNKLIFILAYPSRDEREKSWSAFMKDPDWQSAFKASEVNGKLVEKVDQVFMSATEYSPEIKTKKASPPRIFELRTYTTAPGKLQNLHDRFANHTIKLFSKHGMEHVGYWTPMNGQKGSDHTLIYILAHKNVEAAAESFRKFRADPAWVEARKASEGKAGGSLTVRDGVKSAFMTPTDYSPIQ